MIEKDKQPYDVNPINLHWSTTQKVLSKKKNHALLDDLFY